MSRQPPVVIETVSDLVEYLGGTGKVSLIIGTSPQQVSNMRAEDYIPPKHHLPLSKACAAANAQCPEKFFERRAGADGEKAA